MRSEVDLGAFTATARFCVYVHARPDGRPFYVGKGLRRRAFDFAPSRRTAHHRNIVAKYGVAAIRVEVVPAMTEAEAFEIEKALIASYRAAGVQLINLTEGGEGAAGRAPTAAQLAGLARGRGRGRLLSPETLARLAEVLAVGRHAAAAWRESPEGQEQLHRWGEAGRARLHAERTVVCGWCEKPFTTRSAKARCCSRLCEQRRRRHREKWGM